MAKVLFDPGHGGSDPGAIGASLYESDVVLPMSLLIAGNLSWMSCGEVETLFTRSGDMGLTLAERVEIEHELNPDLFVSVHCNSFTAPEPRGIEVYYYSKWSRGKYVSDKIIETVGVGFPVHGIGSRANHRYYVLRCTRAPAVLVEALYMSNLTDCRLLQDFNSRNLLASMIAQGIWDSRRVWMRS